MIPETCIEKVFREKPYIHRCFICIEQIKSDDYSVKLCLTCAQRLNAILYAYKKGYDKLFEVKK